MATRKSGPTLEALHAQIAELQAQAEALRRQEVGEVIAKIKDAVAHYGLTADDLGLGKSKGKPGRPRKEASAEGSGATKKGTPQKEQTRVAKYRDDQGNSWVGMGKRPAWFTAALASGKTPQDLLA